jgi:hypothetical protein
MTCLSINQNKSVLIHFTKKRVLKNLKELTLFGKTTKLSMKSNISDWHWTRDRLKVHSWIKSPTQLTGPFGPIKALLKTWKLKPRVVHWVHIMVVTPIITNSTGKWYFVFNSLHKCGFSENIQNYELALCLVQPWHKENSHLVSPVKCW